MLSPAVARRPTPVANREEQSSPLPQTSALPYEYGPRPRALVTRIVVRGIRLTSDATVLLLASPFFAVWYAARVGRKLIESRSPGADKLVAKRSKS